MSGLFRAVVVGSLVVVGTASAADTSIRTEASGPRLLFVDGNDIRPEPGGKRLLFVDGDDIRPEPGGKRLLCVDAEGNVRAEPAGVRLAFFDKTDNTLRRKPGGKILLWIKHPEIREDNASGKRLYLMDGDALGRAHVVAVLHHLQPALFQLTKEELAALQKERDEAGREEELRLAKRLLGEFGVLNSNLDFLKKAKITVTPAKGHFAVTLEVGKTTMTGIGVSRTVDSEQEIWLAIGSKGDKGDVKLIVYDLNGADLDGTVYPAAGLADDKPATGTEKLKLTKPGQYQLTAGKAAKTGTEYKGTMLVSPVKDPDSGNDIKSFAVQWMIDKKKSAGFGFLAEAQKGAGFAVAASTDPEYLVGRLRHTSGSGVHIDFFGNAGKAGYILLDKTEK
jgi:hypothetical protein